MKYHVAVSRVNNRGRFSTANDRFEDAKRDAGIDTTIFDTADRAEAAASALRLVAHKRINIEICVRPDYWRPF